MRALELAQLSGKRVLLRIDANVPLDESGQIEDDRRLRLIVPTIQYLLERNARVILLSHLGRPDGQRVESLSLKPVYNHLARLLHHPIHFAPTLFSDKTKVAAENLKEGQILALENLRFDKGEANDSRTFARKLANYGDIYVNDAFSDSHRHAASIVALTEFLPSYPGLLLEKEYRLLTSLLRNPDEPFIAVVGGAKIEDKLPILRKLIGKADRILVGGAVGNTFLAAQGVDVKKSLISNDQLSNAREILKRSKGKIVLPVDYVWGDEAILDIGPKTVELFGQHIKNAHTLFWSGNLGKSEDANFRHGSDAIARAFVKSGATTVVGGGNTEEIFHRLNLQNKVTFISSGGSATLELLSGEVLPGLKALD